MWDKYTLKIIKYTQLIITRLCSSTAGHYVIVYSYTLETRRCSDVESTSMTVIQRRINVVCPVGIISVFDNPVHIDFVVLTSAILIEFQRAF